MKKVNLLKILVAIFSIIFMSCTSERKSIEEKYPELVEAENLFQTALNKTDQEKAEYFERSAIVLEQFIEDNKIDNAYIFYNLGNSWFYADQLGKAIYNYKKAERRKPSNSNIMNNLSFARSFVIDTSESPQINPLIRTIFFLHFDLSFKSKFIILLILLFITITSLILLMYGIKKGIKNILFTVSLLIMFSVLSLTLDLLAKPEGVVTVPEIVARKGDSNGYESSFTSPLHEGIEFELISVRNGWYHIELCDGRQGWIPEYAAQIID